MTTLAQHAPLLRRDRIAAIASVAVALGTVAFLALGGLGKNLVYSWGPAELKAAGVRAAGATVRLGGLVAENSVHPREDGVDFQVTDGEQTVQVRCQVLPPQMFREGVAVVVEGTLCEDGHFDGKRLMVSHGNEYRAGVADSRTRPDFTRQRP